MVGGSHGQVTQMAEQRNNRPNRVSPMVVKCAGAAKVTAASPQTPRSVS